MPINKQMYILNPSLDGLAEGDTLYLRADACKTMRLIADPNRPYIIRRSQQTHCLLIVGKRGAYYLHNDCYQQPLPKGCTEEMLESFMLVNSDYLEDGIRSISAAKRDYTQDKPSTTKRLTGRRDYFK